jgi:tetratricopeptide (TPR) repeat protein
MMRLQIPALLACVAFASSAFAEDPKKKKKMTFDAEVVKDDAKARARLAQAVELYKKGLFETAALALGEIVESPSQEYETVKDDAEFYLGVSLYNLGYYQSALNYFDHVVARGTAHPHYGQVAKWLGLLAHRIKVDTGLLKKLSAFSSDKFQPEVRDELLFLLGRHYFNMGDSVRAASFLSTVSSKSRYYAKAKYFEGLVAVKDDSAKQAVKAFRTVVDLEEAAAESSYEDFRKIKQMGTLALARAYYSAEVFPRAIQRYDALGKKSVFWLDALFESSWAHFRQKKYEKAMGNLFTLSTPFFEDEYYPESAIVQAVILFRNCKFARVRKTIAKFKNTYIPLEKKLSEFIEKQGAALGDFWELHQKLRKGQKVFGEGLVERVVNLAASDNVLAKYEEYLDGLDDELKRIRSANVAFREHPLAKHLFEEVSLQKSYAMNEAGKHAKARFTRARDEVRDLIKQADLITFEIENAEKNRLEEELLREQEIPPDVIVGGKIQRNTSVPAGSQYWPFEGEFWRDELGYYEYQIRSDCKKR